jgi:hypothetical protein
MPAMRRIGRAAGSFADMLLKQIQDDEDFVRQANEQRAQIKLRTQGTIQGEEARVRGNILEQLSKSPDLVDSILESDPEFSFGGMKARNFARTGEQRKKDPRALISGQTDPYKPVTREDVLGAFKGAGGNADQEYGWQAREATADTLPSKTMGMNDNADVQELEQQRLAHQKALLDASSRKSELDTDQAGAEQFSKTYNEAAAKVQAGLDTQADRDVIAKADAKTARGIKVEDVNALAGPEARAAGQKSFATASGTRKGGMPGAGEVDALIDRMLVEPEVRAGWDPATRVAVDARLGQLNQTDPTFAEGPAKKAANAMTFAAMETLKNIVDTTLANPGSLEGVSGAPTSDPRTGSTIIGIAPGSPSAQVRDLALTLGNQVMFQDIGALSVLRPVSVDEMKVFQSVKSRLGNPDMLKTLGDEQVVKEINRLNQALQSYTKTHGLEAIDIPMLIYDKGNILGMDLRGGVRRPSNPSNPTTRPRTVQERRRGTP